MNVLGQARLQNHQQAGDVVGKQIAVDIALFWVMSEAAALVWDDIARWDNGSGRLTVRRSKTDATPGTVYLTPIAMAHLDAIRPDEERRISKRNAEWTNALQYSMR